MRSWCIGEPIESGIESIWFRDNRILAVTEIPEQDRIEFLVDYWVDWENGVHETRVISFSDVSEYRIDEGWCRGSPEMLQCDRFDHDAQRYRFVIQTNFGERSLLASEVLLYHAATDCS